MKPTTPSGGWDLSARWPRLAEIESLTLLGLHFPGSQQRLPRHRPVVGRRVASRRGPHPKPWMEPGSVTLRGEREDVTGIKLRIWRWGDGPGSTGAQCHPKSPYHREASPWGCKESGTTEQLSLEGIRVRERDVMADAEAGTS